MKLLINALGKYLAGVILVGLLLFVPAGSLRWSLGWLFMVLLFGAVLCLGMALYMKAPALLEKRLDSKEKQGAQKGVVAISALLFAAGFVTAGLDFRFDWSKMPLWVTALGAALFVGGYGLYAEVMRENEWLSRTVEVQAGQTVVNTGLYSLVRHPMYLAASLLFGSIPLVLGSWWALLLFGPFPLVLALRIRGEEALLEQELPGYKDYKKKVKYRLIPFVW